MADPRMFRHQLFASRALSFHLHCQLFSLRLLFFGGEHIRS